MKILLWNYTNPFYWERVFIHKIIISCHGEQMSGKN